MSSNKTKKHTFFYAKHLGRVSEPSSLAKVKKDRLIHVDPYLDYLR